MFKMIYIMLGFLIFVSSSTLAGEVLPIIGDNNAKPKNWLDKEGNPHGIMIDLLEEVSVRTGIEFTYKLTPWNRAFTLSKKGEAAIIGFSKTTERKKLWLYSEPMFFDELVFVTLKNKNFLFKNLTSLRGLKLAIKRGSSYGDDFESARSQGLFEVIESEDRAGQIRMLTVDRVDVVLLSPGSIALKTIIAENEWLTKHKDSFVIIEPPYKRDPNFLGIPKSMKLGHLLGPINNALKDIMSGGTYQSIIDANIQKAIED